MSEKIVLIGRGQVGTVLFHYLEPRYDLHWWSGDIAAIDRDTLAQLKPIAVINAAGKTNLAWCEENAREAVRSNVEAPVELYRRILQYNAASNKNCRFVHFSSGCIWDGPYDEHGDPFTPFSAPSPACLYSWTKAACDALLLSIDPKQVAVLRPRQVYSGEHSSRNTLVKLLRYETLIDTPNSMSSMESIERMVDHAITSQDNWQGVWNVYDPGMTTPYEIGKMLAQQGLREDPVKITKASLDTWHHPKRVDTVLFDERYESVITPAPLEEALRKAISELKVSIALQPIVQS